jgi:hypothetical protein
LGSTAVFHVTAGGKPPLRYQWHFNGTNLLGGTNISLTLTNVQLTDAGIYSVTVTNIYPVAGTNRSGSATSSNAVLTVLMPPSITLQPVGCTNVAGTTASFTVAAGGATPLSYRWKKNGSGLTDGGNVSGAATTNLTLSNVQDADAAGYTIVITNILGSITSAPAVLTVVDPPIITTQPANQAVWAGSNATFSVVPSGTAPLSYQWNFNGTNLSGATNSSLILTNVQLTQAGNYAALVTNLYGSVLSSNAVLMVSSLQLTHYVSLDSTNPVAPFLLWATAATNIQDAIDAAAAGDVVLVSNGVYATGWRMASGTNRVAVTNAVTVQSVNGPALTIIQGQSGLIQCAYLINGAVLSGFTLTNGYGGVWCQSTNAVITNTVIINCFYGQGGGAYNGTLNNCTLIGNTAVGYGGGAYRCTLNNCLLTGNSVPATEVTIYTGSEGGGAFECILNNCLLTGNSAGDGGGADNSTLNNCTLVGNYAFSYQCGDERCGGIGGGAYGGTLNNCIIYYNSSDAGYPNTVYSDLIYCCTPNPGGGVGNISFAPRFVDQANGNLRLQSNSPCINAGNNAYAPAGPDLDGNPRIFGGTVDMGAYEFQGPGNVGFVAWLQQYGLPTDGSADYVDSDGDGMNNYQEWIAGTNPTNALSVLKMASAVATNNPPGMVVTWQSVSGITYFLQSSTNLGVTPAFSTIQSNIVGQAGTTSYTDSTATNNGPYFYRVGVQ